MSLDLTQLLRLIEEIPAYRKVLEAIVHKRADTRITVLDAARAYSIAALFNSLNRPVLVITAQAEGAKKLYEQIVTWSGDARVMLFPEPDSLPYERIVSDNSTELERLQTLSALAGTAGDSKQSPLIIVASAHALIQKVTPFDQFAATHFAVKLGMEIDPLKLIARWQKMGYGLENMVEVPVSMSHRGGIVDVYPPTSEYPARIEFMGNTVDSIRLFDPLDQRSLKKVPSITVTPATELLIPSVASKKKVDEILNGIDLSNLIPESQQQFRLELENLLSGGKEDKAGFYAPLFNIDSILNYLPENALLVLVEPRSIIQAAGDLDTKASEIRSDKEREGELPRGFPKPYFCWEELGSAINGRQRLTLTAWGEEESEFKLDFAPAPYYAGQLPLFVRKVAELLAQKQRLLLVSYQANRLSELLEEADIIAPVLTEIKESPQPGTLTLVQGLLTEGWVMGGNTTLLTDSELFGFIKQRRLIKRRQVPRSKLFAELTPGDYVVHVDHGIGKFTGVIMMGSNGSQKEYLTLEYAAGDKLYVPTDQIDRVTRYIGAGDIAPSLSRLGTQEWTHTKQKVKESVELIAKDLLALYASREVVPGFVYQPDTVWQRELEGSFPYVETRDQIVVQKQIKEDMESPKPMDRLVCGDVGYGKTEVSLRGAFKAVMNGKQVAILVPTTVLAEQHYVTFTQRMSAFPVKIEVLSRFRSHKQQKAILEGLADGLVDICIGTHRLIQKDVVFKNLGMLIIDEEQRFGVMHKEYLKRIRKEVDVLTLSATPIPRTLHMALVGVRDMSVMETPPEERLPVKTYVAEYSDRIVREAVLRELERGGQVFFVHNRVQSIAWIASKLQEILPEARIIVAHGQMGEDQLEKAMSDFFQRKADILVCTSIIESGVDMPNVNTLIVNQADKFGLTQLYQLRGRVGRGANLAYGYFLYDKGKRLTPIAEKRLKTIFEATELGAGFGIAMKDLEIRGAGTLLGVHQSGHISAVGFTLYSQMLARAVEEQKAKLDGDKGEAKPSPLPMPSVDLPMPAYIPEDYVVDLNTRLGLYQKLVKVDTIEPLAPLEQELIDRFGELPQEIKNLLFAVRIKVLAAKAGVESITNERAEILISLFEGMRLDRQKVDPYLRSLKLPFGSYEIGIFQLRLNYKQIPTWRKVLEEVVRRMGG